MLAHDYIRNALVATSAIAVACGLVGYFVVLRRQVFAGDALSHVAFTGAVAGAAIGIDPRLGLLAATIIVAGGIGISSGRAPVNDAVIGIVLTFVLGLGVLFLSIYTSGRGAGNGSTGVRVLFGSVFGLSRADTRIAVAACVLVACTVAIAARPLTFASIDPVVAAARGVPVRLIGLGFGVLLGITAAEATQAVGALLLLGLIAAPGGAAHHVTARPYLGLALSALFALIAAWAGLTAAYITPRLPPSTGIIAACVAVYALAVLVARGRRRWSVPRGSPSSIGQVETVDTPPAA